MPESRKVQQLGFYMYRCVSHCQEKVIAKRNINNNNIKIKRKKFNKNLTKKMYVQ